ncbi:MAG TPA: ABC transporter ATP-binding protein [Telluria sp.]
MTPDATGSGTVLRTEGLCKSWGPFKANTDITLTFAPGARHALIGPNGAGKTTLVNLLAGSIAPSGGKVWLGGADVTALPQHRRVKLGMARTFQINTLFGAMTVLESVVLAICERRGLQYACWKSVGAHGDVVAEAMALLATLRLDGEANSVTRTMAYGKQRLVEMALALATRPAVLLLDEPAAGIPSAESRALFDVIGQLPRDVTVLFIEHDMDLVFQFAERITVLVDGRVLTEGTPDQIAADPRVREVYLGEVEHG